MSVLTNKNPQVLLQILPALDSGGVERGTVEIAKAAADSGITSLVASAGGSMVPQLEAVGARHITLPLATKNPFAIIKNIAVLIEVIKREGVTIIHARSRAPAWSAYYAAKSTGCYFITTFHGIYSFRNRLKKAYNSVMAKGSMVIANSHFTAKHIKYNYGLSDKKICVIHRGVDVDVFDPEKISNEDKRELRKEWGLREDWPVILVPGRIVRRKGQLLVLDALSKLHNKEFYCIFLGKSDGHSRYCQEIEAKAADYGLDEQVKIIPPTQAIPTAYSIATAVINASIEPEAFGRIPIEAQAMGIPVIATALGGALETVQHRKTGWLVSAKEPSEMTAAITEILNLDTKNRQKWSKKSRLYAIENFSIAIMQQKTIELYGTLRA